MTIHAGVSYQCTNCGTYFVPMPELPHCPKCGRKSRRVVKDFIKATIDSAMFNLFDCGSYSPMAWLTMNIGDHYFLLAFQFLDFVAKKQKAYGLMLKMKEIPEPRIKELVSKFMKKTDPGEQDYFVPTFKAYLTEVMREFFKQEP